MDKSGQHAMIGAGVVVLNPDNAVLVGYRIKPGETPSWCLPGGKAEPGETLEDAALRELREETGLERVSPPRIFGFAQCLVYPIPVIAAGALCRLEDPQALPRVMEPDLFSCWTWVPMDALPSPLYPATAALLGLLDGSETPTGWRTWEVTTPDDQHPAPPLPSVY